MTRRRKPRDADPVQGLTVGELREIIREEVDGWSHGLSADFVADDIDRNVRDVKETVEDLDSFVLEVWEWWRGEPDTRARREAADADRLDQAARAYQENVEPDGTPPTQERVAEVLGKSDRWLRYVGWDRIVARAAELEAGTAG